MEVLFDSTMTITTQDPHALNKHSNLDLFLMGVEDLYLCKQSRRSLPVHDVYKKEKARSV
jgi:hypothetical protein